MQSAISPADAVQRPAIPTCIRPRPARRMPALRMRGFTLVELMVVLALLGLMAGMAGPVMQLQAKRLHEKELRRALWQLRDAIDAYKDAADQGLIAKPLNSSGYPPSLTILVNGVENQQDPDKKKMVFLRRIPRDPMQADTTLSDADTWQIRGYDGALDADASDVYDVRSRSLETGLNGQPYQQW